MRALLHNHHVGRCFKRVGLQSLSHTALLSCPPCAATCAVLTRKEPTSAAAVMPLVVTLAATTHASTPPMWEVSAECYE